MNEKILVTRLDHYGRGIGKINDKIVFIPFSLPGDEVKIKIVNEKKNYYEGTILEYVKKSDCHIKQSCPFYQSCGGCDLRHISYEEQLKFKEHKVQDIINKFSQIDVKINPIIKCEDSDFYRNKITLKVDKKLGYNKRNTHDIIPITECLIADKKINELIKIINEINLNSIESVVIRTSWFTQQKMVVFYVKKNVKFDENLDKLKEKVDTIILIEKNKTVIINGNGNILERLSDFTFKISPSSFFQVNSLQTLKLYSLVLEKCGLTGKEIVYDLYCGTGTIGIFLSRYAKKVIGIEINNDAVLDAKENAKINNIKNIEFYSGDVSKFIQMQKQKADVIVVDPPRSGLDKVTIDNMIRLNPEKIIYVSCDPVTLARDLNILKEKYDICEITPVDMFPNTYHVECVTVLKIKGD